VRIPVASQALSIHLNFPDGPHAYQRCDQAHRVFAARFYISSIRAPTLFVLCAIVTPFGTGIKSSGPTLSLPELGSTSVSSRLLVVVCNCWRRLHPQLSNRGSLGAVYFSLQTACNPPSHEEFFWTLLALHRWVRDRFYSPLVVSAIFPIWP